MITSETHNIINAIMLIIRRRISMANAYKQAGVNIEAGYEAVNRMKKHVATNNRPEVIGGLGGFGGMFDLSALD